MRYFSGHQRFIIIAIVLCFSSHAGAKKKDIVVSGIVESSNGPAAIINGSMFYVNDSVEDGKITAIDVDGVKIAENGSTNVYSVANSSAATKVSASRTKSTGIKGWLAKLTK